ncbi:hypothetical protein AK812_SmicGene17110 [Symbiodinium microadriaticum]|uniref:Uncharacterized protein n=1 Tax=Symbiodinium microadriaticum TaxID=2951 RepID=A0A1Q9DYK5_SYMMI|nr:hypothetical protein AK812_SmicGene17110 [Symbiodinium microadriaticum]CAE7868286.1 unnamed protein product [Symbiodinium microadriaticum]CAE7947245.1 unnamed protein product [Symbiodinium sp. KB8]
MASSDEENGDDDRDFDNGSDTAQKDLQGLMLAAGTKVRCNWLDPSKESEAEPTESAAKKAKIDSKGEQAAFAQLLAAAKACERFQVKGPQWVGTSLHKYPEVPERHGAILRAVSESLMNRLVVLRVDNFPGSGDPVFGTRHELRRSFRAPDFFGKLTAGFKGTCCLKKVTLQGGFHSASSVCNFLHVVKPQLESFRCRGCLFHGRNFEMLAKALSSASQQSLLEFETDAAIGGKDPFGLLADSFPNLRMLRVKYMFGKADHLQALSRLTQLRRKECVLPKDDFRLSGRPAVDAEKGIVYWFITSEHHDDGYRGEGLWWDELDNTMECCEQWAVGKGVTQEKCLDFMKDCGIELNDRLDDEECGMLDGEMNSDVDSEVDQDTIAVQLEIDDSAGSTGSVLAIKARTMDGREFAQVTLDASKTLVRTLVDELASKYPCSPLAMRLVLPSGACIDALETAGKSLAAALA